MKIFSRGLLAVTVIAFSCSLLACKPRRSASATKDFTVQQDNAKYYVTASWLWGFSIYECKLDESWDGCRSRSPKNTFSRDQFTESFKYFARQTAADTKVPVSEAQLESVASRIYTIANSSKTTNYPASGFASITAPYTSDVLKALRISLESQQTYEDQSGFQARGAPCKAEMQYREGQPSLLSVSCYIGDQQCNAHYYPNLSNELGLSIETYKRDMQGRFERSTQVHWLNQKVSVSFDQVQQRVNDWMAQNCGSVPSPMGTTVYLDDQNPQVDPTISGKCGLSTQGTQAGPEKVDFTCYNGDLTIQCGVEAPVGKDGKISGASKIGRNDYGKTVTGGSSQNTIAYDRPGPNFSPATFSTLSIIATRSMLEICPEIKR